MQTEIYKGQSLQSHTDICRGKSSLSVSASELPDGPTYQHPARAH